MKTLLTKAKELRRSTPTKNTYSYQEAEVVVAYLNGEITFGQMKAVLARGKNITNFLPTIIKQAIENGWAELRLGKNRKA